MSYTLSPNKIKLYTDCHTCFWNNVHLGIERPSGPFPSLPSGMDKILKEHFQKYASQGKLPPELSELENIVRPFPDAKLLRSWQNQRQGIRWQDNKGNTLYGAIDNALLHDEKIVVLDYKTRGFALKEDTVSFYKDQMDIYNYLFEKNRYEVQDYSLLLFYIPKEVTQMGEAKFTTPLVKVPVDTKNAEELFKDALRVLEGKKPALNKDCNFCDYVNRRKRK